jgi:MoxR-like ATPase
MDQPPTVGSSVFVAPPDGAPSAPTAPDPTVPTPTSPAPTGGPRAVTALVDQVSSVVLGDPTPIVLAVAGFLAGGHMLLEDVPGVGKTLLAKALARSLGGSFGRVQGTADLLPTDLTGVSVYDENERDWSFRPGPLFHHVVLVDELNRSTPRTQSALLEAMAERQVSVDGTTHTLPDPYLVIATQNPQDDLGTFPLVAGQRDRFAVSLSLGLPGRQAELELVAGRGGEPRLAALAPVAGLPAWQELRALLEERVFLHPVVAGYALDLVDSARSRLGATAPLSTRAALVLVKVARAHALVVGRDHVTPDDVQAVTVAVLAHRIVDATNGHLPTARSWIGELVHHLPAPPLPARG